jgi:hypothetical protein
MKLAEALILRAEQQKRLQQLGSRMIKNAKVQEGDAPAEDPNTLLSEFNRVSQEWVALVQRINRTNNVTPLESFGSLADAIAARDALRQRADIHRQLADAGLITQNAFSRNEIKFRSAVNVASMQKEADTLARAHRELDAAIQAVNWTTELAA